VVMALTLLLVVSKNSLLTDLQRLSLERLEAEDLCGN